MGNKLQTSLPPGMQETAALQKEKGVLESERSRLSREVTLKAEMERQYAKRSGTQVCAGPLNALEKSESN